ncbi:MAG: hypothetical protein LYZ66_04255 [Nitrososphaerales archaeon]|nr:hypothetical protein [Nitrososphaerales archaeon]
MSRVLREAAARRRTVTYGTLMRKFRLSRGKALSGMIGTVDKIEYEAGAPGFAAIIVRKDTGYPGGGYFCDDDLPPRLRRPNARSNDPRLSATERGFVRKQQHRIWAYYARRRHWRPRK